MILRQCCCGVSLGEPIDDGVDGVMVSHGFCERCYDEEMLKIKSEFPDYPADVPAGRCA